MQYEAYRDRREDKRDEEAEVKVSLREFDRVDPLQPTYCTKKSTISSTIACVRGRANREVLHALSINHENHQPSSLLVESVPNIFIHDRFGSRAR